MDTTPATHELTIPMPVWHTVYATLGNDASVERVGCDPTVAAVSDRIRDAGSAAVKRHPGPLTEYGWPQDDETLTVALADGDEEFLLQVLAKWRRVGLLTFEEQDPDEQSRRDQEESLEAEARALRFFMDRLSG